MIYLATPYSRYPDGRCNAFAEAAKLTARLLNAGFQVFSPIVHTHPIAEFGNIDPYDHKIWLPFDAAMMRRADVLWVALMEGYAESEGIQHEIDFFIKENKEVYTIDPETLIRHPFYQPPVAV